MPCTRSGDAPNVGGISLASAFAQRPCHDLDRPGKIDNRASQRFLNKLLFIDKKLNQIARAHPFEIFRARIALFGERGREIVDLILVTARSDRGMVVHFRGQPGCAQFRRALRRCHARVGQVLFESAAKGMGIDRIPLK